MNKHYLVFAFDKECNISTVLVENDLELLDKFTTKFNNSNDIRNKYSKEIKLFCEQKKEYINKSENKNDRKETGDIVLLKITEGNNRNKQNKRVRVLYSYHIDLFNYLIQNKDLIQTLSKQSYFEFKRGLKQTESLIWQLSEYQNRVFSFYNNISDSVYTKELNKWKKSLKKSDKYFSTIRQIFSIYRRMCEKNPGYESFESLVTKFKNLKILSNGTIIRNSVIGKTKINKNICEFDFDELKYDLDGYPKNYIDNNPDIYETDCDVDLKKLDEDDSYYRHR